MLAVGLLVITSPSLREDRAAIGQVLQPLLGGQLHTLGGGRGSDQSGAAATAGDGEDLHLWREETEHDCKLGVCRNCESAGIVLSVPGAHQRGGPGGPGCTYFPYFAYIFHTTNRQMNS